MDWHAGQLAKLAEGVGRPLHLVVRKISGKVLDRLVSAFAQTTVLDTTSFIKAVRRQRALEAGPARLGWKSCPTDVDEPVDELLMHNWSLVSRSFDAVFGKATVLHAAE